MKAEAKKQMEDSFKHFLTRASVLCKTKADPALVQDIRVEVYGSATPLKQLANITIPTNEQRVIQITPYDKSIIRTIAKELSDPKHGFSGVSDNGEAVRIPLAAMTEEKRKENAKKAKVLAEEAKVSVRNSRQDFNKKIKQQKSNNEITEDDVKRLEKDVQEVTDEYVKKIDTTLKEKEKEIMTV